MALAAKVRAFEVSAEIPFYEQAELEEWAADSRHNALAVAECQGMLAGFFFCKMMSWHWAMLDNFYVAPGAGSAATAASLWSFLQQELKRRRIVYLTALVEEERKPLVRLMRQRGFRAGKGYRWMEYFVERDECAGSAL